MGRNASELLNILQSKESEPYLIGAAAQAIFECVGCGLCCQDEGYALVIDRDINRIAEIKGCTFEEAQDAFTDPDPESRPGIRMLKNTGPDNLCIFLDSANRQCTIYESRPAICRTHPMMNLPGTFNARCPGIVNLLNMLRNKREDPSVKRRIERLRRKTKNSLRLKMKLFIYTLQCQMEDVDEYAKHFRVKTPFNDDNFKKECLAFLLSSIDTEELDDLISRSKSQLV